MSSGGYPSSSERKQYNEEDEKLLNFIRQYRSQSMPQVQFTESTPIYGQRMRTNLSEIIHIPPKYQQFKASLDLPHAAASIIRNSPSSTRTLVQSSTGHSYISIVDQNSSNKDQNHPDPDQNSQSNSTSSWPV